MRTTLRVTMELLSDTIFGSGFSIPGGEDIAVCQDESGYPYLKGSTLKGLLRESLQNWLAWTDGDPVLADVLLGAEGWNGAADGRRVQLTALVLEQAPEDPEACFSARTFTSLENGVVKQGTLRTASCIRSGLVFSGELSCEAGDAGLLKNALSAIKWAGTMRSRGFGRIRVSAAESSMRVQAPKLDGAHCIRYRLRTDAPVVITDLSHSYGNSYACLGYLPGSAVRGMVASDLAARVPEWFETHKTALLSGSVRFLDALPLCAESELVPLPSIKGFYEDKGESKLVTVLKDGTILKDHKRAKLGACCAPDKDQGILWYWSAETGGAMRIQRPTGEKKDSEPFQTRYLSQGQVFEGYILLDDPALAGEIAKSMPETVWLGADRYAGSGKCTVTLLQKEDAPRWVPTYGCKAAGPALYMLALSPLTMLNEYGDPCGLNLKALAAKLGISAVTVEQCSTSVSEYGGYNRKWESRVPSVRMYDRGSIFKLDCKNETPPLEALRALERSGLGIRRGEGFGQVLFLDSAFVEGIGKKESSRGTGASARSRTAAQIRRARYRWVTGHLPEIRGMSLSKSQLGTIQALCEKAAANGGSLEELETYLDKNQKERGARHGKRFEQISRLVRAVTAKPLAETIGIPCADSMQERLGLLCLLFDFSRRGAEKEGM